MSKAGAHNGTSEHATSEVLDPVSRLSEILFGLIMVLTFTGTFSVVNSGREDVRGLLEASLGCNLAWGIVDSFMFLIRALCERGHGRRMLQRLQALPLGAPKAAELLAEAMPFLVNKVLTPEEVVGLHKRLLDAKAPTGRLWPTPIELRGALAVFLLVFISTLPVILPFMFLTEPLQALRLSNAIALMMMLLIGLRLARYAGALQPWLTGLAFTLFGVVLVAATIALGG